MAIYAFCGSIGAGKSLKMVDFALDLCNSRRKVLVLNFALDLIELRHYAVLKKYTWVAHLIDRGQITIIDSASSPVDFLTIPNSVVVIDEAQIWFNSHDFNKIPRQILIDLTQSRKINIDLCWAAQVYDHTAKQWRELTHFFIHASGFQLYNRQNKRQELLFKNYICFESEKYWAWRSSSDSINFLKTKFKYAMWSQHGFLTNNDKQLFKAFDSFTRLEKQSKSKRSADSQFFCILPLDYYFNHSPLTYFDPRPSNQIVLKDKFGKFHDIPYSIHNCDPVRRSRKYRRDVGFLEYLFADLKKFNRLRPSPTPKSKYSFSLSSRQILIFFLYALCLALVVYLVI